MIALSIVGSATLLLSCGKEKRSTTYDYETLMTESSENRTITMMENGRRSYTFTSPIMEGYSLATNPYQEFRRGIQMITYTDSLSLVDATITANYAIYYEKQKLWEAKGNVVIVKKNRKEGDTIVTGLTEVYTQQLFWNATTKKIYSNVDTKVLQPDGWHFGVGFDADEDLKNIHFRRYSSEMEFDLSQPDPNEVDKEKDGDKNKEGDKKDDSKKSGNKNGKSDKGGKSNGSGTMRPATRPNSGGLNTSPTTLMRADRPGAKGDNGNIAPVAPAGNKRDMANSGLKTNLQLNSEVSADSEASAPSRVLPPSGDKSSKSDKLPTTLDAPVRPTTKK
ncbi:MAG: LPS export ABC transporter periplasmic protein LptC [Alistipes sp.]|nr:LPS export ABC transporter periplasmic protein LptC [Alistipes sp.]